MLSTMKLYILCCVIISLCLIGCNKKSSLWDELKSSANSEEKREMIKFLKENSSGTASISPVFFTPDGKYCPINFDEIYNEEELKKIIKQKKLLKSVVVKEDDGHLSNIECVESLYT